VNIGTSSGSQALNDGNPKLKYSVCCQGVTELRNDLCATALREKYMGERIPEVWLNFEKTMMK